jgi:P27 family predicted phage terminase small subunit
VQNSNISIMPGAAGRKRLPDKVKEIRGTLQPCRSSGDMDITPLTKLPEPSNYLTKEGREIYKELGTKLFNFNIINEFNIDTFTILISELSTYIKAQRGVNKEGLTIGIKREVNPKRKIAEGAFKNVRSMCVEFGMTPSSFIKMAAIVNQNKKKDDYESFLDK